MFACQVEDTKNHHLHTLNDSFCAPHLEWATLETGNLWSPELEARRLLIHLQSPFGKPWYTSVTLSTQMAETRGFI